MGAEVRGSGRDAELARLLADPRARPLSNPLFISNLLRAPAGRWLYAWESGVRLPPLRLEGLAFHDGRRVVRARFVDGVAPLTAGRRYHLVLAGDAAVTVFQSTCLEQRGPTVLASVPTEVRQAGFRSSPRATPGPSSPVVVELAHGAGQLEAPVGELGAGGFSFLLGAGPSLRPGDRLPSVRLRLPGGSVEGDGIVRRVGPIQAAGTRTCGVELRVRGRDAARWHRIVRGLLHPHLRTAGAAEAWHLLEACRYVELWAGPQREHLRSRFLAAWDHPAPEVGHTVVVDGAHGPVGLAAGSLLYPGTWLFHHLGVDPRARTSTSEEAAALMRGVLFEVAGRGALEHFVIYVERHKRWNARIYGDFAERHADDERLSWTPVRVHRWTAGPEPAPAPDPAVEVVPAQPWLWERLAARLRGTMPPIERRAFGFDGDVTLADFRARCATHGYERTRDALFALRAGEPIAAAIVETGDEGVNVFGLLNTARLLPLGDEPPDAAIEEALGRAAIAHLRAAGKRGFLWLADGASPATGAPERLGMTAAPAGMRWIAHRDAIPAWSSYLQALLRPTAPASSRALDREGYRALRAKLDFRPRLAPTLGIVALDVGLVAAAALLLRQAGWAAFLLSQVLLAVVFFNAFSILHECGHGNASRSPLVNSVLGHLASAFCFIPYHPWRLIHQQHHLWAGNLERDPTLRSLRRFRDQGVPRLVGWSWRSWVPLAALLQHLVFLSHPLALHRTGGLTGPRRRQVVLSVLWLPAVWLALWLLAPALVRPGHLALAFVLFLAMEELVNLPHHVGLPAVGGRLPPWEQHRVTRSCHYPRGLSELIVLNFNFHVEHHLFPSLPWFRLRRARALVQRSLAGQYEEWAGASWNLHHRARPLETLVARHRVES